MIKKENLSENSYLKEDMGSISSNQKAHNKSFSSSNKEFVNKKPIFKKDSIKSTDNESDLSQKNYQKKSGLHFLIIISRKIRHSNR